MRATITSGSQNESVGSRRTLMGTPCAAIASSHTFSRSGVKALHK